MAAHQHAVELHVAALLRAAAAVIAAAELAAHGLAAQAASPPPAGENAHVPAFDAVVAVPVGIGAAHVEEQDGPPGPPLAQDDEVRGAAPDGALDDEELGEVDEGPVDAAPDAAGGVGAAVDDGEDATTVLQHTEDESDEDPVPDDAEVASVEFVGEMIAVRDDEDDEELGEMPE